MQVRNLDPDVMLIDLQLPDMFGYELPQKICAKPSLAKPVLIAVSLFGHEKAKYQSINSGFAFHLSKPLSYGKLEKIIGDYKS